MGKRKADNSDAGPNAKKMSINPSMPVLKSYSEERFVVDPTSKVFYGCREFTDGNGKHHQAQISSNWKEEMIPYVLNKSHYVEGKKVKSSDIYKGFKKKEKKTLQDAEAFAGITAIFKSKHVNFGTPGNCSVDLQISLPKTAIKHEPITV